MPAMEPLGLRVPLYFIYSDAAKDPDGSPHEFRGFGLFFFKAGSSVLFAQKGRWTHHEEKFLEIDTLELVAGTIALLALVDSLRSAGFVFTPKNAPAQQWSLDICQVFDNASVGTHIANSNKASGATRHAVCTRARVLSDHRIRAHSEHSVRETALASMADDLSFSLPAPAQPAPKQPLSPSPPEKGGQKSPLPCPRRPLRATSRAVLTSAPSPSTPYYLKTSRMSSFAAP